METENIKSVSTPFKIFSLIIFLTGTASFVVYKSVSAAKPGDNEISQTKKMAMVLPDSLQATDTIRPADTTSGNSLRNSTFYADPEFFSGSKSAMVFSPVDLSHTSQSAPPRTIFEPISEQEKKELEEKQLLMLMSTSKSTTILEPKHKKILEYKKGT